jgi:hypothetical protein
VVISAFIKSGWYGLRRYSHPYITVPFLSLNTLPSDMNLHLTTCRKSYPCNRPWRPIELWVVEVPTFSRKSANRWWWDTQPYTLTALYPPRRFLVLISVRGLVDPTAIVRLEGLCELKKSSNLIGNRTRDLPPCSILPQPTTLPRAPQSIINHNSNDCLKKVPFSYFHKWNISSYRSTTGHAVA